MPPSRRQRSSTFPRPIRSHAHRCSRLTRQHGGEQSGLVALTFWSFDLESGVRVTCDVGYLCVNFGLPRPLCSRLRPDVRYRQTSDRRQTKASLNAPPTRGMGITSCRRVAATICPRPSPSMAAEEPSAAEHMQRNVAVVSLAQYVPTLNA